MRIRCLWGDGARHDQFPPSLAASAPVRYGQAMLALYHHGSSVCAAKVRLALAEKGVQWESRYVDILAGEQFAPEFLALNPKAAVPVLIHEGAVLTE